MKELRKYQKDVVENVLASDRDTLISLPTGAGKTVIADAIMRETEGPVCFIVPRLELIKQARDEFGDCDIIWSNRTEMSGKHTIIASKDSLIDRCSLLPDGVTLFFDEAHIGIEQTKTLVDIIKPKRTIGLSATPERMDGLALMKARDGKKDAIHKYGVFDEVNQVKTIPELIDEGWLSPLKYYCKPIKGILDVKSEATAEELTESQMVKIFDDNAIWGDLVGSYEKYGKGRPSLGFTITISMAEKVANIFCEAGYDFRVINGKMNVSEREELIGLLSDRKIDGLVNASLLTYGFDCPPVSYAFSCRHIKSRPLFFQMVGRILRTSEGKENAIFVDHGDSVSEFADFENGNPILNPFIRWRYDGETQEQKEERKKTAKRFSETVRTLMELNPNSPNLIEMEEVTEKYFYDMIFDTAKESLLNQRMLEKEIAELKNVNEKKDEIIESQDKTIEKLTRELSKKDDDDETEKDDEKSVSPPNLRVLDNDETFEFIKSNYARLRGWAMTKSNDKERQHKMAMAALVKKAEDEGVKLDDYRLQKSGAWWKENFRPREYA